MYYNKGLSPKKIALHLGKSRRTIYRWLNLSKAHQKFVAHSAAHPKRPRRKCSLEVFQEIKRLKCELRRIVTEVLVYFR